MRSGPLFLLALASLFSGHAAAENRAALAPGAHQLVVNDVRLWYRVAGRRSGIPVVFLHGGPGQGSQTFATYAGPSLEPHLRMVYLDQRGSGRSERPWTNAYSIDLIVEDLEQLRRRWGIERIALIGHSFGTAVALEYAAKYPDRVSHLILSGAAPDVPAALDVQCARLERLEPETYRRAVERLPQGSPRRCNMSVVSRAFTDAAMFPNPETQQIVDAEDSRDGLRNTGEIGRAVVPGFLDYRFRQHARLTMPVLVITGASDFQAVVEPQRELVARLPRARIVEYEGLGHFMFVEDPERFARDVVAFLRERTR